MPATPIKDLATPDIIRNRDVDAILTPQRWAEIEVEYTSLFSDLLACNGKRPGYVFDRDYYIRDNLLLQHAIHDMFSGFMKLFVKSYIAGENSSAEWLEVQKEMRMYAVCWLSKLTSPRYGYTITQLKDIRDQHQTPFPLQPPLGNAIARRLVGSVIRRSTDAHNNYFDDVRGVEKDRTEELFGKLENMRKGREK